jgi:hypothetical protein
MGANRIHADETGYPDKGEFKRPGDFLGHPLGGMRRQTNLNGDDDSPGNLDG